MKGDFSRLTFDASKHYRAVRMQQGRLQVDADWNEHVDLMMHRLETEVADFIGGSGVPAPTGGGGFAVTVAGDGSGGAGWRLHVAAGHCYVAGRLVENDREVVVDLDRLAPSPASGRHRFVAYADVWSRHVTFVEDPALRDVALGGPDTATREQSTWRVALDPAAADADPATLRRGWTPAAARRPASMRARLAGDGARVENQLYRVEVYDHTGEQVRFTWSRDNASVVARIDAVYPASRTLLVDTAGRDAATSIGTRSWIELVTAEQIADDERGIVVQVETVDGRDVVVTADSWPWTTDDQVPTLQLARRWDDPHGIASTTVAAAADDTAGWVPIEGGLEVRFEPGPDGGADFTPGDYWLIPGRSAGPVIDWPTDGGVPRPQPPAGVRHWYAPLALLERDGEGQWSVVGGGDLRNLFSPLDQGFVTKGASGDTMRGPLAIQPVLQALADDEDLAAVRIDPHFDDNGKRGGRRDALVVSAGDVVLGTDDTPSGLVVNGSASILGPGYARTLTVGTQVVVGAAGPADVRVQGTLVIGDQEPQWPLQIGDAIAGLGVVSGGGAKPDAAFLRFGDGTGWKLHIGRAKNADASELTPANSAIMTLVDSVGSVGIGTTTPAARLHVASSGASFIALTTQLAFHTAGHQLAQAPNNTVFISGAINDRLFFFWKDASGRRYGVSLVATQDDSVVVNV